MSTEFGSRRQRYEDNEGRDDSASNTIEAPAHDTHYNMPPHPDHDPLSGQFNTKEDEPERGRTLGSILGRKGLMIAGGVLAAGVFVGIGAAVKGGGDKAPTPKEPGASAPAVPGEQSPSEVVTDSPTTEFGTTAEYHPTIYETDLYKELDPAQQHEVKKLEEMSYQVFRKLPYEQQLAYGDFYYRAYKEYGMEQVERSIYYEKDTPETVTKDSSGQDILNDFAARQGTIFYSITEKGDPYNINETNREEAKKALSYLYPQLYKESNIYTTRLDQLSYLESLESDETSQYNGDGYAVRKADRESIVGNELGVETKYINVQDTDGEYQQYVYNYTTYEDIQGNERSVWQLQMILGEEHFLYKPDVEALFK